MSARTCPHCDGDGVVRVLPDGRITRDAQDKARWEECALCDGRGYLRDPATPDAPDRSMDPACAWCRHQVCDCERRGEAW